MNPIKLNEDEIDVVIEALEYFKDKRAYCCGVSNGYTQMLLEDVMAKLYKELGE